MAAKNIFTYQTRCATVPAQTAALDAYAALYGEAERSLFAALRAGGEINALKKSFQVRFGISARQFNALRVGLDGKIAAITERRPELIAEAQTRLRKAQKVIANLQKKAPGTLKLHYKKRRLHQLQTRTASLVADEKAGTTRLCFGSKKLFRAQFALEANGYADHAQWQQDWRRARSAQFFVLGSQDEMAGCGECQAIECADGSLALQLRLPNALAAHGTYLTFPNIRFAYGHATIVAALRSSQRVCALTKKAHPRSNALVRRCRIGSYATRKAGAFWSVSMCRRRRPCRTGCWAPSAWIIMQTILPWLSPTVLVI